MKAKNDSSINKKLTSKQKMSFHRAKPYLVEKPTILIVCEGKNTEPSYFNKFRLSSATIKTIGTGFNTVSLVNKAIQYKNEFHYDQVWCVFDADPKPDNPYQAMNFNEAIRIAENNNIRVAYSNQAFEYWIILHLNDHQGAAMPRDDYHDNINKLLKPHKIFFDGKRSKVITFELFDFLIDYDSKTKKRRIDLAINRAENIYNRLDHKNPAGEESSTTVYKLVNEILKYVEL